MLPGSQSASSTLLHVLQPALLYRQSPLPSAFRPGDGEQADNREARGSGEGIIIPLALFPGDRGVPVAGSLF